MVHRISRKSYQRFFFILLRLFALVLLSILIINYYVKSVASNYILSIDEAASLPNIDCILVLGCGVRGDTPSPMLEDRLETSQMLYALGASDKLLMSGDHGKPDYDEVDVMKRYAMAGGVPSEKIFMDHAGFSTYESMYRAKDIFSVKRTIIVTQDYHLYRSLYIARALGIHAYGVSANSPSYKGQSYRNVREAIARVKDFIYVQFHVKPTFLGEMIPVSGNGNVTN